MGRDLGLDGVVDHFTLNSDEAGWLRNKTGATRLGFAVQLKFLLWRGRFPRMRLELPPDAIEHVAKQVGVAASELAFYDFTSCAAKRHRSELRDLTGWHECTKTDQVKLVSHLVDVIWHDERREEQVRAELLRQMRAGLIEPPTAAQVDTIVRSALHQADERAVAEVAARLARAEGCTRRLDALVFTDPTAEQGDTAAEDDGTDQDEDFVESVLADIKAHPGNVSLNSPLDEISKLKQVRAVGVPEKAFAGIGVQVINAWRARASASSPSHLRRFNPELRHVLLAALAEQFRASGFALEFLSGELQGSHDPAGIAFTVLAAQSGMERENIRDRTLEGHDSARSRGKTIGGAGVTDEAMLSHALHLREQNHSLRDIAARLVIATGKKKGRHPHPQPSCACSATTTNKPATSTAADSPAYFAARRSFRSSGPCLIHPGRYGDRPSAMPGRETRRTALSRCRATSRSPGSRSR
ncbi:hypothetical protein GCM10010191_66280 [Actinomadura vinacea]|uniref:DUF4158 domain-containing protein n=1 Tax=Actinomadura vinacea TaxID=115336 RepID=A0ABN3JXL7_9ACTN